MSNQISLLVADYENNTVMSLEEFFQSKDQSRSLTFRCGEDSYIIKPQISYATTHKNNANAENIELIVSEHLRNIGMPPHIKGYQYLRKGIIMCIHDVTKLDYITKHLYPDIAKIFNTSSDRVERAMRHAIETAWVRGKSSAVESVFGYSNLNNARPTNSEFIATLADKIRLQSDIVC